MRLIIAEKPSLGRAIAENIPGNWTNKRNYLESDKGDVVVWCIGHIYGLATSGYYTGGKSFSFDHLPIIPEVWKKIPTESTKSQVEVIRSLIKKASSVVNAGDPDREGQVIVDEVLEDMGYKGPVERLWLNAYDSTSVKRALASMKNNIEYKPLYDAGVVRSKCDWLVGINMTQAFTLSAQKSGFIGTISVGRVQTPTLAMVVNRCLEIENFKPEDYFSISADVDVNSGQFNARYRVDTTQDGVDSEGRVRDKKLADAIVARVKGKTGSITKCDTQQKKEPPPLGYSLSKLQVEASAKFGYSAQMVLDICQALYDPKNALLSYPRTDSEYLPVSQHQDSASILSHLASNFGIASKASPANKGRIFNDSKVTAHHAIAPTLKQANLATLSRDERNIYELVCMRYIAQFFPDYVYDKTSVEVTFDHGLGRKDVFLASGRIDIVPGWREVLSSSQSKKKDDDDNANLPKMSAGESAKAIDVEAEAKQTKPPAYFEDGTLVEAMADVHKVVSDPEIKKRLKEVAGIGTEATRAATIEILFKREFIVKSGKKIKDTPTGRALILALPNALKDPGVTAIWEGYLEAIKDGKMDPNLFLEKQSQSLTPFIEYAKKNAIVIPQTKSSENKQSSANNALAEKVDCPKCGSPMRVRVASQGKFKGKQFLGCTGYPKCNHSMDIPKTKGSAGPGVKHRKAA